MKILILLFMIFIFSSCSLIDSKPVNSKIVGEETSSGDIELTTEEIEMMETLLGE